jgi:hypothetical protein
MSSEDIPAPPNPVNFAPDEIILYGVKLNTDRDYGSIPFAGNRLRLQVQQIHPKETLGPDAVAMAVVYGYAFEGHCYRLDKPRLMIFKYSGLETDADGCGFQGPVYRMWRIGSKTSLLEVTTNFDLAESLILEGNLPGNRAPNTYGNSMQLAHRSGRLGRGMGGGTP